MGGGNGQAAERTRQQRPPHRGAGDDVYVVDNLGDVILEAVETRH
jgi:hypothetical protein